MIGAPARALRLDDFRTSTLATDGLGPFTVVSTDDAP
jgi:hypothetical protein